MAKKNTRYVYSIDVVLDFESGDITGYNFGVVIKKNLEEALDRLGAILTDAHFSCDFNGDNLRTYRREVEEDRSYDKAEVTVSRRAVDHTYGQRLKNLVGE